MIPRDPSDKILHPASSAQHRAYLPRAKKIINAQSDPRTKNNRDELKVFELKLKLIHLENRKDIYENLTKETKEKNRKRIGVEFKDAKRKVRSVAGCAVGPARPL